MFLMTTLTVPGTFIARRSGRLVWAILRLVLLAALMPLHDPPCP
jgi:hypothetical protein